MTEKQLEYIVDCLMWEGYLLVSGPKDISDVKDLILKAFEEAEIFAATGGMCYEV